MASTLGMIATIGFSLAAVFAVIAVIFYVTQHVHDVSDELTGRSAQREISEMRAGRPGRSFLGVASSAASSVMSAARGGSSSSSSSLHVRSVEKETSDMERGVPTKGIEDVPARSTVESVSDSECVTGLLEKPAAVETYEHNEQGGAGNDEEGGTTLLSAQPRESEQEDVASEGGTTLLSPTGAVVGEGGRR